MGKGSCDHTKVSRRRSTRRVIEPMIESLKEEVISAESNKELQNKSLLDYQRLIEKNPRNKSITKLYLTKEVALEMLNIRTNSGDGLGNCVYINVKNSNEKYPFAVSSDCYNIFSDFFGNIIKEIHGEPQKEAILSPQFNSLERLTNINLNGLSRRRSRVIYTEISVRRNLENVSFTPSITKSERQRIIYQIEETVRKLILENEEDEFQEIAIIPLEWEKKMENLKNNLDECGTMIGYPEDRLTLVFRNKYHVYEGCILNFDDHIQYIISTNDGHMGELYRKMNDLLKHESMSDISYEAHPIFGHLTLSPAHLGTGMIIRVIAKFPYISRLADANSIIKQFDCIVENESNYEKTGLLILSNKRTLNITEEEIFKDVMMAFNKLSQYEDEFEATTPLAVQDDSMSSEDLENLYSLIKVSDSLSYTKKYLTENVVKQYRGLKSNFGSTLNNCIRHNAYFPRSLYPRACDANCYLKFSKFFDPIILESNASKSFIHGKKPFFGSTVMDSRYQLNHPNIMSYRVRFSRNIEKFPFPMMMSNKDRFDVERIMKKAFEDLPAELEGEYCSLNTIKESIHYEDILFYRLTPEFVDVDLSAGFYRDYPTYRGIFVCKKNKNYPNIMLVVIVNMFDHMKIIAIDPKGSHLNICYERAINMMKFLNLRFENKYAQKSDYGFLTSFPSSVGCAMRVSALVKLKYLGDKREQMETECITLQIVYRGSKGHGTIAERNVFDLSLKMNMNVTEEYILMMFVQRLKELINIERQFDSRIPKALNENPPESSDGDECDDEEVEQEDSIISEDMNSIHSPSSGIEKIKSGAT